MPNRKAAAGLVLGVVLIIVLIPTMIGLLGLGKMVESLFGGTADIIPTEGLELVALGNPGNLMVAGYGDGDAKLFFGPEVGNEFPNVLGNGENPWVQVRVGDLDGDGIDDDFIALTENKELVIFNIRDYTEQYTQLNDYDTSDLANPNKAGWDVISLEEASPIDSNIIGGVGNSLGGIRAFRKDDGEIIIGNKPLLVGDLDGDGDDEIIVLGVSVFHIYRQTDSGEYEEYSVEYYDSWEEDSNTVSFLGGVEVAGISDSDLDGRENNIVLIYRSTTNKEKSPRKMRTLEIEMFQLQSGWLAGVYATGAVVSSAEDLGSKYKDIFTASDSEFSRYYTGLSICDYDGDGFKDDVVTLKQDIWGYWAWDSEGEDGVTNLGCDLVNPIKLASAKRGWKAKGGTAAESWSGWYVYSTFNENGNVRFEDYSSTGIGVIDGGFWTYWGWPICYGDYKCGYFGIGAGYLSNPDIQGYSTCNQYTRNSNRADSLDIYLSASGQSDYNIGSINKRARLPKIQESYKYSSAHVCTDDDGEKGGFEVLSTSWCPQLWKQDWLDIACGDLDNDGKVEIALLAEPGHIYIAEIDALSLTSAEATAFTKHESIINTLPWTWIGLPEKRWTSLEVANIIGEKTGEESETLISE